MSEIRAIENRINSIRQELSLLIEDIQKSNIEERVWDYQNGKFINKHKELEYKAYMAFTKWVMENKIMLFVKDIDIEREYLDLIGRDFGIDFDRYLPR